MLKIRKLLIETLSDYNVYFDQAPNDALFPHVVVTIQPSSTIEEQELFPMDIDVWDLPKDGSTVELEQMASSIWKKMHKFHHIDDDIQISIYRQSRLMLDDNEKNIKRRKLTFDVKYFDRGLYCE